MLIMTIYGFQICSPAYGTLSDYQFMRRHTSSDKRKAKARAAWGDSPSTLSDIIQVFVNYTTGEKHHLNMCNKHIIQGRWQQFGSSMMQPWFGAVVFSPSSCSYQLRSFRPRGFSESLLTSKSASDCLIGGRLLSTQLILQARWTSCHGMRWAGCTRRQSPSRSSWRS